ncbi:MAG TPA: hypothetical protein PKD85_01665 [Saprospiraceae bacterium]|nr:hypothetical protein [Saprospiraceae bacterium]
MKPGFEENFIIHNLLREQRSPVAASRIPAIADNYNKRAMLYDTNFDVASTVLATSSALISGGSALYFNTSIPLYLFALALLFIFIGSMALRSQRENFINLMANEESDLKDKVQMVAQHNTAYIKNKLWWLAAITFTTLTIIGISAVLVTDVDLKWPLLIASPVLALIICNFIYLKDWYNVSKLLKSLNQDIQKELIQSFNPNNAE